MKTNYTIAIGFTSLLFCSLSSVGAPHYAYITLSLDKKDQTTNTISYETISAKGTHASSSAGVIEGANPVTIKFSRDGHHPQGKIILKNPAFPQLPCKITFTPVRLSTAPYSAAWFNEINISNQCGTLKFVPGPGKHTAEYNDEKARFKIKIALRPITA